jgi:hypothetical protein
VSSETGTAAGAIRSTPYLGFVPWVIFGVVARRDTLQAASVAALAAAIAVSIPSFRAGRPKILELATILALLVYTVVALATDPSHTGILDRYARAIAAGTLTVIAVGSLLTVPFTEQYARESTSPELWHTATFRRTNRVFTAMWAAVFAAMTVSHVIAGAIDTARAETIFNWVIPIALVVAAFRYMERYRSRLGSRRGEQRHA